MPANNHRRNVLDIFHYWGWEGNNFWRLCLPGLEICRL